MLAAAARVKHRGPADLGDDVDVGLGPEAACLEIIEQRAQDLIQLRAERIAIIAQCDWQPGSVRVQIPGERVENGLCEMDTLGG